MANRVPVPRPRPSDYKRFMDKVVRLPDGCWEWIGGKFQNGYGMFWLDGKQRRAHRVLYVWSYGELDYGTDLDHLCRNRACVNPDHLEAATRRENVLRGDGPTAKNAKKDISSSGNELDYVDPRGWRGSRTDRAEAVARYLDAHRDQVNARRRERRQRVVHDPRACDECGQPYTPIRITKKFCSEKCQARANNRKQAQKRRGG